MNENFIAKLPAEFTRNTLNLCGAAGEKWLNDLPQIVGEIEKNWSLKTKKPFQNLSYNYVAPCLRGDDEAVLKIAPPFNPSEIFAEAKFLQTANGVCTVKLFETDESRRAILLEKLMPGENLKEFCRRSKTEAVEIAVRIMRGLVREPPPRFAFRELDEWFNNFFGKAVDTKFPAQFQNKAREFYEQLSSASKRKFLLHGDLHHENILSAGRAAFLAIDPKGVVGEIGYEIAVFLNNHLRWSVTEKNLRENLTIAVRRFSEAFEIEPIDLRKWAYTQAALSAWWTFDENGENWEKDLALAEFWEV